MLNVGIVLERSVIYDRIWGYDFGPAPSRWTSTSATCGARPRRAARTAWSTRSAGVGYVVREPTGPP